MFLVNGNYKTLAKAFHHTLSLSHTCSAPGEHHFQNHHERSIRSKNAYPKPGKIPLPRSGTAGLADPNLVPRSGPRRGYTRPSSRRVGPLRSSVYLAAPKTSRDKGPIFGHARRRHGAGKRVHFGSPHRSLEFTSRRFSQPPISTPQQLSSGLRYTHCDANLGNSHRSISLKPISKTPNMLLCFHSKAELQLLTFRHSYMTWLAKPCYL